jgi:hypothetical protein
MKISLPKYFGTYGLSKDDVLMFRDIPEVTAEFMQVLQIFEIGMAGMADIFFAFFEWLRIFE